MKKILGLKRHHYLKTVSIFLIAVMLIVGVVSCEGEGEPDKYNLAMAVSPAGGGTATDVIGGSPYEEGTDVSIQADPAPGYQFIMWTAPAGSFANANAAATTFTMPAQNVTVTAHFVGPLDHFKGYEVADSTPLGEDVILSDQFFPEGFDATVQDARLFFNPTDKLFPEEQTLISNEDHHLTLYQLGHTEYGRFWNVEVTNQFNGGEPQYLTVGGPVYLAVPTQKTEPGSHGGDCVDFEDPTLGTVYSVGDTFTDSGVNIEVKQFQWTGGGWTSDGTATIENGGQAGGSGQDINCNNVNLNFDFGGPVDGLTLLYGEYGGNLNIDINSDFQNFENFASIPSPIGGVNVLVTDFGGNKGMLTLSGVINSFDIGGQELWIDHVCPTAPHEPPLGLDHYLVYVVVNDVTVDVPAVELSDQFGVDPGVIVGKAALFANPVQKTHGDEVTDIKTDEHLVFYEIYETTVSYPQVTVNNQFGDEQNLYLGDPAVLLGVPSAKKSWGEQLDHFTYYPITEEPIPAARNVTLDDQFVDNYQTTVWWPYGFCNPAAKTLTESWPPIVHPDYHLTFYQFEEMPTQQWFVEVENQFGKQVLTVVGPIGLLVPTQKIEPGGHAMPEGLDHFSVYEVLETSWEPIPVWVQDQFGPPTGEEVTVWSPYYFAVPVQKTVDSEVTAITNPLQHLVFYEIMGAEVSYPQVQVADQFLAQTLTLGEPAHMLGVPSLKLWWEGPEPWEPLP